MTDLPTPQSQGVPVVDLGQSFTLRNVGGSRDGKPIPESATMTLIQVIDPVSVTSPNEPVPPGRRTIGLKFTVENHADQPILDVWGEHELQLTFGIYGSDRNGYSTFDARSAECPSYDYMTVIAPGATFTGCEFASLPPGVTASQVLIGLFGLGPESTDEAAWRVQG
jgi:hypothetical protein